MPMREEVYNTLLSWIMEGELRPGEKLLDKELATPEAMEHLTEKDFKEMTQANNLLRKALENLDPVQASIADVEFHDVFIQRSANPHLIAILGDLQIKYRRLEVTCFEGCAGANQSADEHDQILEALQSENIPLAQSLIRSNWQNSLQRLENIYTFDSAHKKTS